MTATKKTRAVRLTSSALRLDTGEVAHVGVDVHKASYHVAVVTDLRGLIATWTQPADPALLVGRLAPVRAQVAQVVYEAGPTGFALVRRLQAAGLKAEVIAPSKIPTMPGPEAKSDRLDCRKLAVFAQKGLLRPVRVPDEREEADRQVVRLREQLARKLRVIQQQIKALLLQHGIAEPAGLAYWTAASIDALRQLGLDAGVPHGWRAPGKERRLDPRRPSMAKTRRTFTPEFKAEAVRLVTEQGRSFVEAAHDLDIGESTLRSWRQAIVADGERAFPGRGNPPAHEEELRRLRAEIKRLTMEREILKKATAFFARESS